MTRRIYDVRKFMIMLSASLKTSCCYFDKHISIYVLQAKELGN